MFSSNEATREIQEEFLIAFEYFHTICVQNNIQYSIHAGSMLGAVRHSGFIPWDDDIDVTMTREEYKKWRSVIDNINLRDGFYFEEEVSTMPHFCMQREGKPTAWISIFIYDYISENRLARAIKLKIIGMYTFAIEGTVPETISPIKRPFVLLLAKYGKMTRRKGLIKSFNYFCENRFVGKKRFIHRSNDRYSCISLVLPETVMSKYETVSFEGCDAMISKNYDEILTSSYGSDYMTPKQDTTKEKQHGLLRENLNKTAEHKD